MPSPIIGFSANAEITFGFDSSDPSEKLLLKNFEIFPAGSSVNVATALAKCGYSSLVVGLTGKNTQSDYDILLNHAMSKLSLSFKRLSILKKANVAVYPIDKTSENNRVIGSTSTIISREILDKAAREVETLKGDWRIATGIIPAHTKLLLALFNGSHGYRVLNPKPMLLKKHAVLKTILGCTDMLLVNKKELQMARLSLKQIHSLGVRLIIITEDKHGGYFSLEGKVGNFQPLRLNLPTYSVGTGDWFNGGFLSKAFEIKENIGSITFSGVQECVHWAAIVAGIKVTMRGATNGPGKKELKQYMNGHRVC